MRIDAGDLTAVKNENGSVDFVDGNGESQFRVGIPYLEDAAGEVLKTSRFRWNGRALSASRSTRPTKRD